MTIEFEKALRITKTGIPGLLVLDLPVHGDNRGWFKENWQRAKMVDLGLPDFKPVQNNISFNIKRGVTRGIHAEPWDKYISIATGEIFGAWVDLREGPSFGKVFTTKLDPSKAIFVPRGVGNSFQTLTDGTAYTYLVNAHWSMEQKKTYTFVNLADPDLDIEWPIPLEQSERSEADLHHPMLKDAKPMAPKRTLVIGSQGQLGKALHALANRRQLTGFEYVDYATFDINDSAAYQQYDWDLYGTIINAAAFTAVDKAETADGRKKAWQTNVTGVANLARVSTEHNITLVHISSDYVFDGKQAEHDEYESFAPLGVYGETKAAADAIVSTVPRHYIIRSSWIVGQGHNFVTRMIGLAKQAGNKQQITAQAPVDQDGRLTFATDLAEGILHLLAVHADYGTYNLTGSGPIVSWYVIAKRIFEHLNVDTELIDGNSVDAYVKSVGGSPRPHHCGLKLDKIVKTGFQPKDWQLSLDNYIASHISN